MTPTPIGHPTAPLAPRAPRILLCSAWQVVNIGDIAHTPGALALLERYLPEAVVTLWAYKPLTPPARDLILRRFPRVEIVDGRLNAAGEVDDPATLAAIDAADFFLHGSGPATLGWAHASLFVRRTGRKFGVFGVTYGLYGIPERAMLSQASFVYFRDSVSLARAQQAGVNAPVMGWAPDTAFAFEMHDDTRAARFLADNGLQDGEFLCCISRYRNTPFWLMPSKGETIDLAKQRRNEEMKVADHAPLLEAITLVVRQTPLKVLLCPEDETQMEITRTMLLERLPADVRPRVIWRDRFWLPDEAVSVYQRSAGLFGHEMHSPIMCIGHGVPAIVCRWAEQSSKGYMWRDIGLAEWLFDLDSPEEAARVAPAVLAMAKDPAAARRKAAAAAAVVRERFHQTMSAFAQTVHAAVGSGDHGIDEAQR